MMIAQGSEAAPQLCQQPAAFRGLSDLSRRKGKYHCVFCTCGNQVQFYYPAAAVFANGLRAIF